MCVCVGGGQRVCDCAHSLHGLVYPPGDSPTNFLSDPQLPVVINQLPVASGCLRREPEMQPTYQNLNQQLGMLAERIGHCLPPLPLQESGLLPNASGQQQQQQVGGVTRGSPSQMGSGCLHMCARVCTGSLNNLKQ